MYLKKLEMFGFKSFADRTEFEFRPGVTGVVGPNGCGKSNVVDAFKWIFGEQSAKGLRGSEMKDVIFNGTQARKPSGFSEVTVVFENEDRFLDIDYTEVAVTRRLFRSGESEYLINKQKCRLKDIKELFLDTGLGRSSYSILEQGKIDVLLQSSAMDRRMIFEEAAGISRYRVKKAETVRALLRVEDNLSRLQDIIDEVEKRIRRVKAQAGRARRYRELSKRLKDLRIRTALDEYRGLVDEREDLSFRLWWTTFRVSRLQDLERRITTALDVRITARQEIQSGIREQRNLLSEARSARERVQERIENDLRRTEELRESVARKSRELEETRASIESLGASIEDDRNRREELRSQIAHRREELVVAERELEEKQEIGRRSEEDRRERQETLVSLIHERSRITNAIVQLESEAKNLEARKERLEKSLGGLGRELEECRRSREGLEARRAETTRARDEVARRRDEHRGVEERIRQVLGGLDSHLVSQQAELHRKSSRYEVLESFEESLDGVGSGVAALLQREGELPPSARSCGMVASLIKVERCFARAVEGALGDLAEALVVESQEGALDLLMLAKSEGLGSVKSVVLERVEPVPEEFFPRQGGVLGPLRARVEVGESFAPLLDRLLANVVLVEDLETAVALSRNGLRPFRLVTLDGEVVEPWGGLSVTGAAEAGLISRRSEMEELLVEVRGLERAGEKLRAEIAEQRREQQAVHEQLEEEARALEELERSAVGLESEARQIGRDADRLSREITVSESELGEVLEGIEQRARLREEKEQEGSGVDRRREKLENEIRDSETRLEGTTTELERLAAAVSGRRLDLARAEKQDEGLARLIEERNESLEARQRRSADIEDEIETLMRRSRQTEEGLEDSRQKLDRAGEKEERILAELSSREAEDEREAETERALRAEIEASRSRAGDVAREKEELQLRAQEERYRRNSILERLDDQYGIDLRGLAQRESAGGREDPEGPAGVPEMRSGPAKEEGGECARGGGNAGAAGGLAHYLEPVPDWDRERARGEVKELQEKIRRLGNVNLDALEELEELEERHAFQISQKADLVESEGNLRSIIGEINEKSRAMFLETFGEVQGHFGELFRKCFGGGRAELVLEEAVDVLDAGIEIVARPPGKKLTTLSLMSGGEKTMVTLALLLAIFRSRPSPFCILDEVDAPLDEANVGRFVVLLEEFIGQSQFIIITHNKVSMATASVLYGVTMQERGVSKKVAVELESYDPESAELSPAAAGGR